MERRVSFALLPIDDFTDKVITNKTIVAKIDGSNSKPIKKQDGFIVFTNIDETYITVTIHACCYNTVKLKIDITKLNKLIPIIKVRLKPNEHYSFPSNITCLRGKTSPNTTLTVIQKSRFNLFRLLDDNKKDTDYIKIYNPMNVDLEGRNFIIKEKSGETIEGFTVVKFNVQNNTCILNKALKGEYKKEACEIIKIDNIDVFEDGYFFLPLRNAVNEENTIIIENNNGISKEIILQEGIVNNIEMF